ncbi:hypothetical protein GUJ93_ZPchr0001g31245 [Zizania palustris]|uniref:Uncharacterized protein n=1 Tax=Zizania palustris TaxID=103762 RepID=A0A8J5S9P1_ZIZPA|nr:hypothetical protein GUJ93_ZPchr0001g31245 [Zizania palustris]
MQKRGSCIALPTPGTRGPGSLVRTATYLGYAALAAGSPAAEHYLLRPDKKNAPPRNAVCTTNTQKHCAMRHSAKTKTAAMIPTRKKKDLVE